VIEPSTRTPGTDAQPPPGPSPWPGLRAYADADRPRFHGREDDVRRLYRVARASRATLLHGPSASGKTSLLRAGLLPRQQEEDALTVYVQMDGAEQAPTLVTQVKRAIASAVEEQGMRGPEPREHETLWEYLHQSGGWFWSRSHRIVMPFIVLDQFEEVLAAEAAPSLERDAFFRDLADLTEDRVPAEFRRRLEDDPSLEEWYASERHHYKILISVRDESKGEIDRVKDLISPKLLQNAYRLEPLRGDQAMAAVLGPGSSLVGPELAERIVRKAAADEEDQRPLEELRVHPAALSVLCMRLDEERLRRGGGRFTEAIIEAFGSDVLREFFEDGLRESTRGFASPSGRFAEWWERRTHERRLQRAHRAIEERLLTEDDRRREVEFPDLQGAQGLDGPAVDALLERDILRGSSESGRSLLRLSHDVLVRPVRQSGRTHSWHWIQRLRGLIVTAAVAAILLGLAGGFGLGLAWGERAADPSTGILYRAYVLLDSLNTAKDSIYAAANRVNEGDGSLTDDDSAAVRTALIRADHILSYVDSVGRCADVRRPAGADFAPSSVMAMVCQNRGYLATQAGLVGLARGAEGAQTILVSRGFYALTDSFDLNREEINAAYAEMLDGGD
jgi:hypothetical protein